MAHGPYFKRIVALLLITIILIINIGVVNVRRMIIESQLLNATRLQDKLDFTRGNNESVKVLFKNKNLNENDDSSNEQVTVESTQFLYLDSKTIRNRDMDTTSYKVPDKFSITIKRDENRNRKYDGINILDEPSIKFDPSFKNPCWFEKEGNMVNVDTDDVTDDDIGTFYESRTLRCLPYVFVIGVKKCGTSDLFLRLSLHPDFVKAGFKNGFKEAQWFPRKRFENNNYTHGSNDNINYYIDLFRSASNVIETQARNNSDTKPFNYQMITGEGSPSNLHLNTHWMNLPGNEDLEEPKYVILDYIKHLIPTAKIIITFRDPIERLYSDYYHYGYAHKTNPSPAQFHTVVEGGIHLYRECFKRHSVRSCVYNPKLYDLYKIQFQLGIYYIYWQDLMRVFPRHKMLVLQNKNLHDKATTMTAVYEFLEMRKLTEKELHIVVKQRETFTRDTFSKQQLKQQGPMLNKTFDMLQAFYQPFNVKMAEITNDRDFLYQRS